MDQNPDEERLAQAIEDLHDCDAFYVETVHVREPHDSQTAWEGDVAVFDLVNHPTATQCYAWKSGGSEPRYYAVLHVPPIDSAAAAVRATIIRDYKRKS